MSYTTYSFSDIHAVFSHPSYPAYTIDGRGIGEINIAWGSDNTAHNVAADGNVMISKVLSDNGTFSITIQQTSPMHQWLRDLFNFLMYSAPTSLWAAGRLDITNPGNGFENIQLTGVSFAKRSDQVYQAQAQMVTWNLMFARGQSIGSILPAIALNTQANII